MCSSIHSPRGVGPPASEPAGLNHQLLLPHLSRTPYVYQIQYWMHVVVWRCEKRRNRVSAGSPRSTASGMLCTHPKLTLSLLSILSSSTCNLMHFSILLQLAFLPGPPMSPGCLSPRSCPSKRLALHLATGFVLLSSSLHHLQFSFVASQHFQPDN